MSEASSKCFFRPGSYVSPPVQAFGGCFWGTVKVFFIVDLGDVPSVFQGICWHFLCAYSGSQSLS